MESDNSSWELMNRILAYQMVETATILGPEIDRALENRTDLKGLSYQTKYRVKTAARIIEKVNRKLAAGANAYTPQDVTDVCGFRIVTYYQSGVAEVIRHLLALVCHEGSTPHAPFVKEALPEVTIYTTRHKKDPLSIVTSVQEVLKGSKLPIMPTIQNKETGYSSVHVVIQCETALKELEIGKICVEFQVRSAFEEVWGEVDHKLRYGTHRGAVDTINWDKHLNALKTLVDGCVQYLELIKQQADREQLQALTPISTKRSTNSAESALSEIATTPPDIRKAMEDAYTCWNEAVAAKKEQDAYRLFRVAADAFQSIWTHKQAYIAREEDVAREVGYSVQMELAYCLMYTGDDGDLKEAIRTYTLVEEAYPEDGVSRFRHSQALSRLQEYPEALERAEAAKAILDSKRDKRVDDQHWVHSAIRRHLGYVHWLMSQEYPDTQEGLEKRLTGLRYAIDYTRDSIAKTNDPDEYRLNVNNLVYYGWEERQLNADGGQLSIPQQEFEGRARELQSIVDISNETDNEFLDTLMRIFDYIGNNDGSRKAAIRVIKLLEDKIKDRSGGTSSGSRSRMIQGAQKHLDKNELDSYIFASNLLSSTG